jgi:hypothetical protein
MVYADDSNVWQSGKNVDVMIRKLAEKAALFVDYTRSMGLSMNASKTQMLLSANAGNVANITMMVDGISITPKQHHRAPGGQVRQEVVNSITHEVAARGR